ncbi:unnamed protein product, partial [marine sediment metagenome]
HPFLNQIEEALSESTDNLEEIILRAEGEKYLAETELDALRVRVESLEVQKEDLIEELVQEEADMERLILENGRATNKLQIVFIVAVIGWIIGFLGWYKLATA